MRAHPTAGLYALVLCFCVDVAGQAPPASNSFVGGGRQEAPPPIPINDDWSLTLRSWIWSKYLGPNGAIYHNHPVIQSSLIAQHSSGVYLGLWTSIGLESSDINNNFGDEIDLTVGWANKKVGIDWNAGVTYVATSRWEEMRGDVIQMYVEGKRDFVIAPQQTLSPFGRVDYYVDTAGTYFKPWLEVGTYHSWKVAKWLSVVSRASVLYDTGVFGQEAGFVAKYKGGLNWTLGKFTIELPAFKYTHPFMNEEGNPFNRIDRFILGGGVQFNY